MGGGNGSVNGRGGRGRSGGNGNVNGREGEGYRSGGNVNGRKSGTQNVLMLLKLLSLSAPIN